MRVWPEVQTHSPRVVNAADMCLQAASNFQSVELYVFAVFYHLVIKTWKVMRKR